jgi:hypothetical protein
MQETMAPGEWQGWRDRRMGPSRFGNDCQNRSCCGYRPEFHIASSQKPSDIKNRNPFEFNNPLEYQTIETNQRQFVLFEGRFEINSNRHDANRHDSYSGGNLPSISFDDQLELFLSLLPGGRKG